MDIIHHLEPHTIWKLVVFGVDLSISKHVIWMWISCGFVFSFFWLTSKRGGGVVPKGVYNIAEVIIKFVNEQLVIANVGEKEAKKWFPFLCTLFLFILANNLLGLIPGSATATSNINVTGALALVVFLVVQGVGVAKHGLFAYVKGWVPSGLPLAISIAMFPLELVGQLSKPFSLAIRLFANMFAGHAVLLVFLGLIVMGKSYVIAIFPLMGVLMISVMEIGFACIQAFIFTVLSGMYIGQAIHGGH